MQQFPFSIPLPPLSGPPAPLEALVEGEEVETAKGRFFRRRFTLLPDREELSTLWQALVEAHGVTGFRAHDVRFVAAMQSYGIARLLTFNADDFRGLPVTTLDPASV